MRPVNCPPDGKRHTHSKTHINTAPQSILNRDSTEQSMLKISTLYPLPRDVRYTVFMTSHYVDNVVLQTRI